VIFERFEREDRITLKMINMGGDFRPTYITKNQHHDQPMQKKITRFLQEDFGEATCRKSSSDASELS